MVTRSGNRKRNRKSNTTTTVTVFDFLNDLTYDKKFILNENNEHLYNSYIINSWLSLKGEYFKVSVLLNKYLGVLDKYQYHRFAMSLIPTKKKFRVNKGESPFLKPLKNKLETEMELISEYFDVSTDRAFEYYDLLKQPEKNKLIRNLKLMRGDVK